jgi:hypothetical protein
MISTKEWKGSKGIVKAKTRSSDKGSSKWWNKPVTMTLYSKTSSSLAQMKIQPKQTLTLSQQGLPERER